TRSPPPAGSRPPQTPSSSCACPPLRRSPGTAWHRRWRAAAAGRLRIARRARSPKFSWRHCTSLASGVPEGPCDKFRGLSTLSDRILQGDSRAIARGISTVEDDPDAAAALVRDLFARSGRAFLVGVT